MEKQILKIADDLRNGEITPEYAQELLLRLFGVINQVCDKCQELEKEVEYLKGCIYSMENGTP